MRWGPSGSASLSLIYTYDSHRRDIPYVLAWAWSWQGAELDLLRVFSSRLAFWKDPWEPRGLGTFIAHTIPFLLS